MKYLVKLIFETEEVTIGEETVVRETTTVASYLVKQLTNAKHKPRGGSYIFLESDIKLNHPIVSTNGEGELILIEDPAKQVELSVTDLYKIMQTEVLNQMSIVFGTANTDSALRYKATWEEMTLTPSDYSVAGLTSRFVVGIFVVGDALDTDQKVTDYASAKITEAKAYGVWVMQRIEQFRNDKALLLA